MSFKPAKEADIQAAIRDYLALRGAVVIRVNSGRMPWTDKAGKRRSMAMNDSPGCSDLLVCFRGKFLALEVKRPGEFETPKQAAFLERVRQAGGFARVVRSVGCVELALAEATLA